VNISISQYSNDIESGEKQFQASTNGRWFYQQSNVELELQKLEGF